jgi:hypothetical protein
VFPVLEIFVTIIEIDISPLERQNHYKNYKPGLIKLDRSQFFLKRYTATI